MQAFERAAALIPVARGKDSPHAEMAVLALQKNDRARAIAELQALVAVDFDNVDAARQLASLMQEAGIDDAAKTAPVQQRIVAIDPFDAGAHRALGRVAMQMNQPEAAAREFRAVLALDPVDQAAAHTDLAESYLKGGKRAEAKKQGKVRFVGFTGHKSPAIHLKMLAHDYPFDTVQMPLTCFDATYRSFEQQVLPELQRRGIAALGMKSLGGDGQPIQYGVVRAEEALRYAMSLPVATTICGIDSLDVLHQNVGIARGFKPMSQQEMQALRERCRPASGDGHLELFKTTKKYDGSVGREQHGYPTIAELPL